MRSVRMWSLVASVVLLGVAGPARAGVPPDLYTYRALLDTDNNPATGCDVAAHDANFSGPVSGIEFVVSAFVDRFPSTASVVEVQVRQCVNGMLGAPIVFDNGDWAIGNNDGTDGSDVVEFYVPRSLIGNPETIRLAFHATRSFLKDVLLTTNGQNGGTPIIFRLGSQSAAPALSVLALAVLTLLLAGVAWWTLRLRAVRAVMVGGLLVVAGAMTAWAVTIALDGNVSDWTGVPVAGTDALNDSSAGDPAEDIVDAFVTADAQNVYFRMDQVNLIPVVCGNGIVESGEGCETAADCAMTDHSGESTTTVCSCVMCQCSIGCFM